MKNVILYLISFSIFMVSFYSFLYFYNQKIIFQESTIYTMDKNRWPLSEYDKKFVFKIGKVSGSKKRSNHFSRFPHKKKKEVIRIGTFGDSFTYGFEVEKGWSYPAHLKKIFDKYLPEKKIEVLNFGMNGHGFQQHFLVWKEYAKKYNIDYVLLGPEGSQPDRDLSFITPWTDRSYFRHPSGRYILKKNGSLEFINIKGETFFERYKNYYTLYPSWTILKYDKHFLDLWKRVYFPFWRVKIQNPFYYSNLSTEKEATAINRILLKEMESEYYRKVIFLSANKDVYSLYKEKKDLLNLNYLSLFPQTPLYYRHHHYSTLGYEAWANVFFKALTGNTDFSMKLFHCLSRKKNTIVESINKMKLIKEVFLYYKDLKIAKLDNNSSSKHTSFQNGNSFITFFNSSEHFMNGIFYSVPFQLNSQNKIFIKNGYKKHFLGSIFPLDEKNIFFGFQKDYIVTFAFHAKGFPDFSYLLLDRLFSKYKNKGFLQKKGIDLYIDNYKIADLKLENSIYKLISSKRKALFFLGELKDSTQHKDLPDKINFSFKYTNSENKVIDSSVLGFPCVKKTRKIHVDLPNFDFL